MKSSMLLGWAALGALLLTVACTDPTFVGAELLDQDRTEVAFTDTLTVEARTISGDSILIYQPAASSLNVYLFGDMADPIFGRTIGSVYLRTLFYVNQSTGALQPPDFSDAVLDSVVLIMPVSSSGGYGPVINGEFGFEVSRLTEAIDPTIPYYSNVNLATGEVIGSAAFEPNFDTTYVTSLYKPNLGDTALFAPHLRIPLSMDFGQAVMDLDTNILKSDSAWLEYLPGIYVRPTVSTPGLLNLNLQQEWGGIYFYYRQDRQAKEYVFPLSRVQLNRYEHDPGNSPAGQLVSNPNPSTDTLMALQGMEGMLVELKFPDLASLSNYAINRAELELTAAILPQDNRVAYTLPSQLLLLKRNATTGNFESIYDVNAFGGDFTLQGGAVQQDGDIFRYQLNLPFHLQFMQDGIEPATLYLAVTPRAGRANRVLLRNANATQSPARLKLALTRIR